MTVFPISNRVTDQVIMINSVITIFINNIIISITIIFAIFIADEEDEGREVIFVRAEPRQQRGRLQYSRASARWAFLLFF